MERFLSLLGILRCIYSSSVINSLKDQKLSVFQVKATLSKKHRIRPQTGLILNGISANNGVVRLFSLNSNIQKIFDFFYIIVLLIALLAGKKMQILFEYYFQKKKNGVEWIISLKSLSWCIHFGLQYFCCFYPFPLFDICPRNIPSLLTLFESYRGLLHHTLLELSAYPSQHIEIQSTSPENYSDLMIFVSLSICAFLRHPCLLKYAS